MTGLGCQVKRRHVQGHVKFPVLQSSCTISFWTRARVNYRRWLRIVSWQTMQEVPKVSRTERLAPDSSPISPEFSPHGCRAYWRLQPQNRTGLAWAWLRLAGAVKLCLDDPTDSLFPRANILAANLGRPPDHSHRAWAACCPVAASRIYCSNNTEALWRLVWGFRYITQ